MPFVWVFLAATAQVTKDIISKRVSVSTSGLLSAFASFLFPLPLYVLLLGLLYLCGVEDFQIRQGFLLAVVLRASTDTVAETSKMHALAAIEFSTYATIVSLNSFMVLLLSPFITGDPLTGPIIIGVVLSVCGALLTTFRPGARPPLKGLLLCLLVLVSSGLMNCFDRISVRAASGTLCAFSMTLLSAIFLAPIAFQRGGRLSELRQNARPFLVRSVFEVTSMSSKLIAAQYLTAPEVTTLMRLNLVIAVIAGQRVFQEEGFWRRFCGVMLVISGALVVCFQHIKL